MAGPIASPEGLGLGRLAGVDLEDAPLGPKSPGSGGCMPGGPPGCCIATCVLKFGFEPGGWRRGREFRALWVPEYGAATAADGHDERLLFLRC